MSLLPNDQNANGHYFHLPLSKKMANEIGAKLYRTGKPCFRGHDSPRYTVCGRCIECTRTNTIKYKNPDKKTPFKRKVEGVPNAFWLETHGKNSEILKNEKRYFGIDCRNCGFNERYKINGSCVYCSNNSESSKKWAEENKERTKQNKRAWLKKNAQKIYVYNSSKEKRLREATPSWLTDDDKIRMDQIYLDRQQGYHVDHIVPIRGKNVCGLHVYWNMQYMTTAANIGKTNKLLDEYADCTATVARDGTMTDLKDYVAELVADKPEILIEIGQVWRWKGDNGVKLVVVEGDNGMSGSEKMVLIRTLVRDNGKAPQRKMTRGTAALRFKIRYELTDIVNNS